MEHSENKIITNFENEVGPRVLQFIIQQASPCKNSRQKTELKHTQKPSSCTFDILEAGMYIEHWTGTLQVQSRFQRTQIA